MILSNDYKEKGEIKWKDSNSFQKFDLEEF